MLLEIGLGLPEPAAMLNDALHTTLRNGCWTDDLGGNARCSEFGAKVREELSHRLAGRHAHLELMSMNRGCCG
jgi:isocitrate/isopropylmalate dehydrogenase